MISDHACQWSHVYVEERQAEQRALRDSANEFMCFREVERHVDSLGSSGEEGADPLKGLSPYALFMELSIKMEWETAAKADNRSRRMRAVVPSSRASSRCHPLLL